MRGHVTPFTSFCVGQSVYDCFNNAWRGVARGCQFPFNIFSTYNNFFLANDVKRGKQKKWGGSGRKGSVYINPYPANVEYRVSS